MKSEYAKKPVMEGGADAIAISRCGLRRSSNLAMKQYQLIISEERLSQ